MIDTTKKLTNRLYYLIEKNKNKPKVDVKDQLTIDLLVNFIAINKPIEQSLFLYNIKETELVNSILERLNNLNVSAIEKQKLVVKEVKKEKTKSSTGFIITGLAAILGSALVFKHLKGIKVPLLGSIDSYFKSEKNILTLIENKVNVVKELSEIVLPDLSKVDDGYDDVESVPDYGDDEEDSDSSLIQEALDKIYAAKAGVESITEAVKINFNVVMDNVSRITKFAINVTPFGILNLLFGKNAITITDKLQRRIETFYNNFWTSASNYIRDLFKWIQLKDIVNPITGLATGFTKFVGQKYSTFIRQFSGSNTLSEEQKVTQSSVLATTATIFSRLTSTLSVVSPTFRIYDTTKSLYDAVKNNINNVEEEYETITETITEGGGKVFVIGDSIAVGYMNSTKFDGNAVGGKDPSYILSNMIPDFIKRNESGIYKTVVLSSGMTNAPYNSQNPNKTKNGLRDVDSMLQRLSDNKDLSIVLFGVVNIKHDYKTSYGTFTHDGPFINYELQKISTKYNNVRFTGPIPDNSTASDKLHASNYNWVGNIKEGEVRTRTVTRRVKKESNSTPSNNETSNNGSISAGTSNDPRISKYVDFVIKNKVLKSLGKCATYVRRALNHAGFYNRRGKNQLSAYMYHTNGILSDMGFKLVGSGAYSGATPSGLKTGDVIVWNRNPKPGKHNHGHISITINDSGKQCSDFLQPNFASSRNYIGGGQYYVYRLSAMNNNQSQSNSVAKKSSNSSNTAPNKRESTSPNTAIGIGGPDENIENTTFVDESGKKFKLNPSAFQSPKEKYYNGQGQESHSTVELDEIYSASNGAKIVRIEDNNKSVLVRLNRTADGKISGVSWSPPAPPQVPDVAINMKAPKQSTRTLQCAPAPIISETPGRHPLDLLLSSEIMGNMGTII